MKKIMTIMLLFAAVMVLAQEVPASFPRKLVIEHFTGDECGYCPNGMNAITDFVKNQYPSAIWVSHHEGYNTDEYTIRESSTIANLVGVSGRAGTPSVALNRTKRFGSYIAFAPDYLPDYTFVDTLADASVVIEHTYNADTRQLDVTVRGQVADAEVESYLLTVLLKENRLVGKQKDYLYSWQASTWKEYMHARVVRTFLTAALGDEVVVENQAYSKTFRLTVDDQYVAENCCVVAYITPLSPQRPIINAEQVVLVAGTTGGEEYFPYGITESLSPPQPIEVDSVVETKVNDTLLEVKLIDTKSHRSTGYGPVKPVGLVYLNTEANSLEEGTYTIEADGGMGTIVPGYRIDEECGFGGSRLVLAIGTKLATTGEVVPGHVWRMNSGSMEVDASGNITIAFTAYNGKSVKVTYAKPATAVDNISTPGSLVQKIIRDGRVLIERQGKWYDLWGMQLGN